jgi:hypothetical protein
LPHSPEELKITETKEESPGTISVSANLTSMHPQDASASIILKGDPPLFLNLNEN